MHEEWTRSRKLQGVVMPKARKPSVARSLRFPAADNHLEYDSYLQAQEALCLLQAMLTSYTSLYKTPRYLIREKKSLPE